MGNASIGQPALSTRQKLRCVFKRVLKPVQADRLADWLAGRLKFPGQGQGGAVEGLTRAVGASLLPPPQLTCTTNMLSLMDTRSVRSVAPTPRRRTMFLREPHAADTSCALHTTHFQEARWAARSPPQPSCLHRPARTCAAASSAGLPL